MAKYIHGRTDNAIKNHWNSALRRGRNIEHLLDQNGALPTQFPQGLPEQPARTWAYKSPRITPPPPLCGTISPRRAATVSLCGRRGGRGECGEAAWPGCRPCGSRRCDRGTPLLGRRLLLSLRLQPQSRLWLPHQSRHSHASAALEPASSCSLCQVCRISS